MTSRDFDVRHIARLARIALAEKEVDTFQGQLDRVLEHIAHLKKVDVSTVEPTAHTYPIFNIMREDLPQTSLPRDAVLSLAPRAANGLVVVPKVVE